MTLSMPLRVALGVVLALGCGGRDRDRSFPSDASPTADATIPTGPDGGGLDGGAIGDGALPDAPDATGERCDPTAPLGRPVPYEPLTGFEASEPWVTGDGLTMLLTRSTEDFRLELWMTDRATRGAPFATPTRVSLGAFGGDPSQSSLAGDGSALYFMAAGDIYRAVATETPGTFSEPVVVDARFPPDTRYPEYPREAGGYLHYTLRELNGRRSLYAHHVASATTEPLWYDAGDIFTFAVSPNHLFLYVTFDVGHLETYRMARATPTAPFGDPERVDAFLLDDPSLSGFMPTGVTDDDCEIFGSAYDLSGVDRVMVARRGD